MNRTRSLCSSKSLGITPRYTVHGRLLTDRLNNQRIYQPTYQLEPKRKADIDSIRLIIKNTIIMEIVNFMPIYDARKVKDLVKTVCDEITYRLQLLGYDRMRTIVISSVTENHHQGINWRMGALLQSTTDQWISFEHKTASYVINVLVALIYWE